MDSTELADLDKFLNDLDPTLGGASTAPPPAAAAPPPPSTLESLQPRRASQFKSSTGNLFESNDGDEGALIHGDPNAADDLVKRLMNELTVRDVKIQALATENEELRREVDDIRKSLESPPRNSLSLSTSPGSASSSSAAAAGSFSTSKSKITERLHRFGFGGASYESMLAENSSSDIVEVVDDPLRALGIVGNRRRGGSGGGSFDMSLTLAGSGNHLLTDQQREEAEARRDRERREARAEGSAGPMVADDDEEEGQEGRLFRDSADDPLGRKTQNDSGLANEEMGQQEFVHRLMRPECEVLVGVIRRFLSSVLGPNGDGSPPPPNWKGDYQWFGSARLPQRTLDFIEAMREHFQAHPSWRNDTEEKLASSIQCLEKYIMSRIGDVAFKVTAEHADDEALARRMQLLQFLTPGNLEIPSSLQNDMISALAISELRKINGYRTPVEKLLCVEKCSAVIFRALTLEKMKSAGSEQTGAFGADDFFPLFLFAVLKSNVPKLCSNASYIQNFTSPQRLMGLSGYVLVAFRSAIEFIQTCDSAAVSGFAPGEYDRLVDEQERFLNGGFST